mgnify:CR=1 FL=1
MVEGGKRCRLQGAVLRSDRATAAGWPPHVHVAMRLFEDGLDDVSGPDGRLGSLSYGLVADWRAIVPIRSVTASAETVM